MKNNNNDNLKAGIAGATLVAAGVAAVALSKKENRKKISRTVNNVKKSGVQLTKEANKKVSKTLKKAQELKKELDGKVKRAKDDIHRAQMKRKRLANSKISNPSVAV